MVLLHPPCESKYLNADEIQTQSRLFAQVHHQDHLTTRSLIISNISVCGVVHGTSLRLRHHFACTDASEFGDMEINKVG
ncbi:predicted protein [Plenodomus lingam JN3]|uniref:Predicted protein n=1 Tax=Leptosphaeria maculans (strain JN3 / isolate v23.1.3 / race Av1-4-5-6-7-8) TaxID=985895 RepID=E4ZJI2_LEPMJ|nr:predicted protein [Plenodomus lingam JN3]CBX91773.1 predicted protein [Plenodomus lingam JN3]